jgi:hypothetical protein
MCTGVPLAAGVVEPWTLVTVPTDWAVAAPRGEATKSTMARKRKRGIIRLLKLDGTGIAILRVEDFKRE